MKERLHMKIKFMSVVALTYLSTAIAPISIFAKEKAILPIPADNFLSMFPTSYPGSCRISVKKDPSGKGFTLSVLDPNGMKFVNSMYAGVASYTYHFKFAYENGQYVMKPSSKKGSKLTFVWQDYDIDDAGIKDLPKTLGAENQGSVSITVDDKKKSVLEIRSGMTTLIPTYPGNSQISESWEVGSDCSAGARVANAKDPRVNGEAQTQKSADSQTATSSAKDKTGSSASAAE
jgi:hypothetical protein